jgi:hypothetical protein
MFNEMDRGLKSRAFEFQTNVRYQIGPFLARFDAIFTLNQDLLLERKYRSGMPLLAPGRWSGFASPGVYPASPSFAYDPDGESAGLQIPGPTSSFRVHRNTQPYFKLHGSSNWRDSNGERMLIMGGEKSAAIRGSDLLTWYAKKFEEYLQSANPRLMVIGYSFADPHINQTIVEAIKHGLRIFIVDPRGSDVLDGLPKSKSSDDLRKAIQPTLIGASRRPPQVLLVGTPLSAID